MAGDGDGLLKLMVLPCASLIMIALLAFFGFTKLADAAVTVDLKLVFVMAVVHAAALKASAVDPCLKPVALKLEMCFATCS